MVQESGRLQRLLQDMRQPTQLDITGSVRTEQVDPGVLCTERAQRFRIAARDAGITVTARAARIVVTADSRLVDTVVGNFMSNAIRYTPQGGKVEIRAHRRPAATVIAVRDTGAGIAPVHLERIFHRLYRADDARDRATGGSGLGLAIARGAARSLGGRIEVDSQPGSQRVQAYPAGRAACPRRRGGSRSAALCCG